MQLSEWIANLERSNCERKRHDEYERVVHPALD